MSQNGTLAAGNIDVVFYDNRFGTIDDTAGVYTQISTLPITAAGGIAWTALPAWPALPRGLRQQPAYGGLAHRSRAYCGNTGLGLSIAAFAGGEQGLFEIDYASNL